MAFNPEIHDMDQSGFMIHKETGARVGLEPAPFVSESKEFPKWVEVHKSHIVMTGEDRPITPLWPEFHVDRNTGMVSVLVQDEEEEKRATSEAGAILDNVES